MPGNNYPKLHNAMWPGLSARGPNSEPPIDLDTMLELTADARAKGQKFEGVDLFLADPHTSIDLTKDDIQRLADKIARLRVRGRLGGRARVAPGRRRLSHGLTGRTRQICLDGRKGLPHRATARDIGIRQSGSSESIPLLGSTNGRPIPSENQKQDRRDVQRGLRRRRRIRRTPRGGRRNLLGRHAQLEGHGRACWRRWGGRRPWASRPTWPTRCSTPGLQRPGAPDPSRRL